MRRGYGGVVVEDRDAVQDFVNECLALGAAVAVAKFEAHEQLSYRHSCDGYVVVVVDGPV